jgi:hypothetical protein|tara:strand:+ start:113 stop:700 length:588 start_codon:yes stop_codon:yes gene_type:complete
MRSIHNYIISTNNRYNNKISVDDKELILNTEITERDYMFVNRIATVESTPIEIESPIEKGDEIIVHHNVFRRWFDIRGEEKNSANFLSENTYFVTPDQVFAYKRNDGWKGLPGFCFVKPIENKDEWGLKHSENLAGELIYTNDHLSSLGISVGDVIGFQPDSEYEFTIENQRLYRILSNHITINYGSKTKSSSSS